MPVFVQKLQVYSDRVDLFVDHTTTAPTTATLNVYVALSEFGSYHVVQTKVLNVPRRGTSDPTVPFSVSLAQVTAAHASLTNATFEATPLFFKVTEVTSAGVESALVSAKAKNIGTVGINRNSVDDVPARTAQLSMLSQAAKGWVPGSGSSNGNLAVSQIPFYEDEFVIERTFSGANIATELIYLKSDPVGARAMKIVYSAYTGSIPGKIEYLNDLKP
jgi:hypothetical protein